MGIIAMILLAILIPALAAGAAVAVYYLIYTKRINRKIQSGEATEKKMPGIAVILRIAGIAAAVLICGVLAFCAWHAATARTRGDEAAPPAGTECSYYLSYLSAPEGPQSIGGYGDDRFASLSYAMLFSAKENEGYRKIVKWDGDFTFTVFITDDASDDSRPGFLCFIDYAGEIQPDTDATLIPEFVRSSENAGKYSEISNYGVFSVSVEPAAFTRYLCLGSLEQGVDLKLRVRFLTMGEEAEVTISLDE